MPESTVPNGAEAAKSELLENLLQISLNLSATRDRKKLLDMILTQARRLTGAQAGSLYIRYKNCLEFVVAQNDAVNVTQLTASILGQKMVVGSESLAGFVAASGRIINLPDAYQLSPGAPFRMNRDFDTATGYRTRSVLAIPLKCPDGQVVGVLQLINRLSGGSIVPFDEQDNHVILPLASMAAVSVQNALLTDQLKQAHLDSIIRLSVVAEFRDRSTAEHIKRMSVLSAMIARALKLDNEQVELIQCASPMHDIGKIGIPDAILLKPGPLTPDERKIVETHTLIGGEIIGNADNELMVMARDIALCHHERFDGGGYPRRLSGGNIPLPARIVCLADVFDALATRRCYKDAYPADKVMDIIRKEKGRHFDAHVLEALLGMTEAVLDMYVHMGQPPASAVVARPGQETLLQVPIR